MSALSAAWNAASDLRHLGPGALGRFVGRPDELGCRRIATRHGVFWIRPRDTDLAVIRQIYRDRHYDLSHYPQAARIGARYRSILDGGRTPVIVDAGANIGAAARYFAEKYPRARISAVEPDPRTAAICRRNTAAHPAIAVIEAAIGARPGMVELDRIDGQSWATRTRRSAHGMRVVTVPDIVATVADGALFIVKIDIEGFEADLFSSDTDWIDDACVIIVEPHDWLLPEEGTSHAMQRAMGTRGCDLILRGESLVWIRR